MSLYESGYNDDDDDDEWVLKRQKLRIRLEKNWKEQ